jgi:cell filamentation protein
VKNKGRYDVSNLAEAQYEPGSDDKVLKNMLGVTNPDEMDRIETGEMARITDHMIKEYDQSHRFNAIDICHMHNIWPGEIYEWAGRYRRVNLSKDDFSFAMASQIPQLMEKYEKEQLAMYTPCIFDKRKDVVHAIAETHTELVLIHPFRDGNGRVARLLSTLMALQAELPANGRTI